MARIMAGTLLVSSETSATAVRLGCCILPAQNLLVSSVQFMLECKLVLIQALLFAS